MIWYYLAPIDDDDRGFLSDMIAGEGKLFDFPEFLRLCCLLKGCESQLNLDSLSNSSLRIYSKALRLRNRFYSFTFKGFL